MSGRQKLVIFLVVAALVSVVGYFLFGGKEARKPIELNNKNQSLPTVSKDPANTGPVGAITGVSCENWNRRPVAVMQPVDSQARPVAGFSDADMVFEMPNPASGIFVTRLMGVYQCETRKRLARSGVPVMTISVSPRDSMLSLSVGGDRLLPWPSWMRV